eukprot:4661937-Lingulodinium_polyedra.AAC.1
MDIVISIVIDAARLEKDSRRVSVFGRAFLRQGCEMPPIKVCRNVRASGVRSRPAGQRQARRTSPDNAGHCRTRR